MIPSVLFVAVALVVLVSAVFVVMSADLVRAVLWLALSLIGTAALYGLLQAPFLAGVQILTYVGGVVTLLIFGVMVTRRHEGEPIKADGTGGFRALLVSGGFFGVMAWALSKTPLTQAEVRAPLSTGELATALLGDYLFAFEVASVLLLAAIVGAIVLARRKDPEPTGAHGPIIRPGSPEVPQ